MGVSELFARLSNDTEGLGVFRSHLCHHLCINDKATKAPLVTSFVENVQRPEGRVVSAMCYLYQG